MHARYSYDHVRYGYNTHSLPLRKMIRNFLFKQALSEGPGIWQWRPDPSEVNTFRDEEMVGVNIIVFVTICTQSDKNLENVTTCLTQTTGPSTSRCSVRTASDIMNLMYLYQDNYRPSIFNMYENFAP